MDKVGEGERMKNLPHPLSPRQQLPSLVDALPVKHPITIQDGGQDGPGCLKGLDNAIHRINHNPADKCWQNKPRYPRDSDLSGG